MDPTVYTVDDPSVVYTLSEREVARRLGVSVALVRKWRHRGQGPRYLKLGTAQRSPVRYAVSDLVDYVDRCVRQGTREATPNAPTPPQSEDHGGAEVRPEGGR